MPEAVTPAGASTWRAWVAPAFQGVRLIRNAQPSLARVPLVWGASARPNVARCDAGGGSGAAAVPVLGRLAQCRGCRKLGFKLGLGAQRCVALVAAGTCPSHMPGAQPRGGKMEAGRQAGTHKTCSMRPYVPRRCNPCAAGRCAAQAEREQSAPWDAGPVCGMRCTRASWLSPGARHLPGAHCCPPQIRDRWGRVLAACGGLRRLMPPPCGAPAQPARLPSGGCAAWDGGCRWGACATRDGTGERGAQ